MLNSTHETHNRLTYSADVTTNKKSHQFPEYSQMEDPIFVIFLAVLLLHLPYLINVDGSPNLHTFMYKYCSTDKLDVDPNGMFSDTRQSLVQQLLPHSSQSKSYRTAVLPDQQVALWGHFQCRGDLLADECHSCVDSFSNLSSNSWCVNSLAARVQLYGCHIQYEADGSEIPGADLNHNGCGQESAVAAGDGFEEAVRAALATLESGVMENPNGYCSVDVGGVYAVAQCAEGLSGCDCGECVAKAAGVAAEECAGSLSGHAYLDMCYVSFEFRPGGGPSNSNPGERRGGFGSSGKLVAIAAGGVALVIVAFILLKKSFKKDDGKP
ncbi:hypothetical protein V2J09_022614 [Rumex salicifolius]